MSGEWVPVAVAAKQAGVTRGTVHKWTWAGDIPFDYIEVTGEHFTEPYKVKAVRMADVEARRDRPRRARTPKGAPCVIEGCGKPILGRGWCSAHYTRYRRTGDPLTPTAKGADIIAEFWHFASLIGEGPAVHRLAEVYGIQANSVIDHLQRGGWSVHEDDLGRIRITEAENDLRKEPA